MIISKRHFRDFDFLIMGATLSLVVIGLLFVYSTTYQGASFLLLRQVLWIFIGIIVAIVFYTISLKVLGRFSWIIYLISLIGLLGVLAVGTGPHGVRRWFSIGGIVVQPSEIAKLGTLVFLASFLANKKFRIEELRHLTLPILIVVIPFLLVLVEPDLGTSIIFLFLGMLMLVYKGTPLLYLFVILSPIFALICGVHWIALIIFLILVVILFYHFRLPIKEFVSVFLVNLGVGIAHPIIWNYLKPYQRARITSFLFPSSEDYVSSGWQPLQSKIAVGSGGFFGKGFLNGTQKGFDFLPEAHTDFIFSVIGEELGFCGCCLVLVYFFIILWRGLIIAKMARSEFNSFIAMGVVSILGIQVFMNVGMTTGFLPVVGVPLSFISYGGSSMITSFAMIGILLNVAKNRYEY